MLAATNDPTPTISGTGEAGAIVTVRRLGVISSLASVQNAPAIILSADGNTAYVAEGTDGLQIIDVTNPAAAVVINSVNTSGFASSVTLSPDGNTAYVATDAGLDIIDLINGTIRDQHGCPSWAAVWNDNFARREYSLRSRCRRPCHLSVFLM